LKLWYQLIYLRRRYSTLNCTSKNFRQLPQTPGKVHLWDGVSHCCGEAEIVENQCWYGLRLDKGIDYLNMSHRDQRDRLSQYESHRPKGESQWNHWGGHTSFILDSWK
jgi:hypothetical protein